MFQSLNPQGLVQKSVFVLGNLQSIHFLIIRIKIHLADISSFSLRRYNIYLSYFLTFTFSLSKLKQKTLSPVNQSSQPYLPTANWFNNFLLQTIMAIKLLFFTRGQVSLSTDGIFPIHIDNECQCFSI